jgi:hypothetical protein
MRKAFPLGKPKAAAEKVGVLGLLLLILILRFRLDQEQEQERGMAFGPLLRFS